MIRKLLIFFLVIASSQYTKQNNVDHTIDIPTSFDDVIKPKFENEFWFMKPELLVKEGGECQSSLMCETLCCSGKNICQLNSVCKKNNLLIYLLVAFIALIFVLGTLIYFWRSIKEITQSIENMQKEMELKDKATEKLQLKGTLQTEMKNSGSVNN